MSEVAKNSFTDGLNQDSDPSFQKNTTMRNNLNGRVAFNVGGSYSYQPQQGNQQLFFLNCNYGANPTTYRPTGWAEFADKLVILSTDDFNSEIGIVTVDPYHITPYQNYQTIYNDIYDPFGDKLGFSTAHDILAIVANKENQSIQRIYWTDDYKIDRVFNVVEGLTINNPAFTNGDYNPLVSTGLYPTFYSAFSMDSVPDMLQGTVQFVQTVSGEKLSGVYQYCYRLVTKDGYKTPFTIPTRRLFLTTDGVVMNNSARYAMQASQLSTSKGIQIQINDIDTRYYQIEVCYIYAIAESQSLNAAVFATINIDNNTSLTVDDISNGGTPIALETISRTFSSFQRIVTMGTREKRLYKGGITAGVPPNFDPSHIEVEPYIRSMVADQTAISYNNTTKIQKYLDNTSTPQYTIHQIKSDYVSYSGVQLDHLYGGYFRGETYRMGILFTDKKGFALFAYHIADITMTQQYDNHYTVNWLDSNGTPQTSTIALGAVGDYKLTDNNAQDNPFVEDTPVTPTSNVRNRILGMIFNNIDLTDIIDEIGGFAIVRVERDPTILAQGLLLNMVHETGGSDSDKDRPLGYPSDYFNGSGLWLTAEGKIIYGKLNTTGGYTYTQYVLNFDSPDYLFDNTVIPALQSNHQVQTLGAVHMTETVNTGNEYGYQDFGADNALNNGRCGLSNKTEYTDIAGCNNIAGSVTFGQFSYMDFWVQFGFDTSTVGYDPANPTRSLEGFVHIQNDGGGANHVPPLTDNRLYNGGIHNGAICIKTQSLSDASLTIGTGNDREAVCYMLANYIIANKTPYGGVNADSLAQSIYIPTGHFQPINETVKAQILSGGKYIFDGVEVWGGDCYVDMFSYARVYAQNDLTNHSIAIGNAFPCEMKYNGLLRKGNTWQKSGFLAQTPYFPDGVNKDNMEPELINSVLLYSEANALYTGIPLNYSFQSDFSMRWYYSDFKTDGELVDSWRLFPVNQFADIDGRFGNITGCTSLYDQIYSFQERAFGRLRILDRVPLQDPATGGLKIGTGGVLDYIEYTSIMYGTQNSLSIINTGKAVYWIDVLGKTICRFSQNGFEQIDIVHGMHNYIQALFSSSNYDFSANNPSLRGGIHGIYDKENKEVLFSFINRQDLDADFPVLTLGFSELISAFSSFYSFRPRKYLQFASYVLSYNAFIGLNPDGQVYRHNVPDQNYAEFYTVVYDTILEFVSNVNSDETKMFDNLALNGDNFKSICTSVAMVTDQTTDIVTPVSDTRAKYREGTLVFPMRSFTAVERTKGQYCVVTVTIANSGQTSLKLKSAQVTYRYSRKI